MNPDIDFEMKAMQDTLRDAIGDKNLDIIDATGIASALMGASVAQPRPLCSRRFPERGIPLSLKAIMRAIEINGAAIEMNKQAFRGDGWPRTTRAHQGRRDAPWRR